VGRSIPIAVRIAEKFDLPLEAVSGVPRLTVTGDRQALVENHRGILIYCRERIEIDGGGIKLIICGDKMELAAMSRQEILIKGRIISAELI